MKQSKTKKMVIIAMMSAVSYVLMFIAFPVIPAFSFMKVDFSDVPILICSYILGPGSAVIVAALRSILHFMTTGAGIQDIIGNVAGFLASVAFILPVYYLTKKKKNKANLIVALLVGTVSLTLTMMIANYTFVLPLYAKFAGFVLPGSTVSYLIFGVAPFNLLKGILVSSVFYVVHKKILPWLVKQGITGEQLKH